MGQLLLPLFPADIRMITLSLGVREGKGTVYYLHSGMPIFSHASGDMDMFRYITSNLILQGLCNNQDIVDTFHVSADSVRRWKNRLADEGEKAFFKPEARHGRSHKLLPEVLDRIQAKLDDGKSAYSDRQVAFAIYAPGQSGSDKIMSSSFQDHSGSVQDCLNGEALRVSRFFNCV
jgi:hypothetical protein